jgi:hypothetical protein
MSSIVLPTVDEYLAATDDQRRAYLACITTYHVRDYLARAEGVKKTIISESMRSVCANSFDVVEGICNGSKHCGNTHDDFRFAPGAEQVIPSTGYGVGGYGVGRYSGVPGLVVEHNGLGVLVDVGLCDVLSVYGQLYPAHFASIDLEKYRKRVPGSR